jgi:folate-dependent tRNA-U54 methylase TrmFO/GidA
LAIGSLIAYITRKDTIKNFQPMNVNFGLFDQVDIRDLRKLPKKIRDLKKKERLSNRALEDMRTWIQNF